MILKVNIFILSFMCLYEGMSYWTYFVLPFGGFLRRAASFSANFLCKRCSASSLPICLRALRCAIVSSVAWRTDAFLHTSPHPCTYGNMCEVQYRCLQY